MNFGVSSKIIAAVFALAAFTIAIISGLAVGNPAGSVLLNAMVCLLVCQVVGLVIGGIATRVVHDHIETYKGSEARPGPASARPGTVGRASGNAGAVA